jgi:hypothetical protein
VKAFLSYRDVETSKAAVQTIVTNIRVPLLIVYDRADNIQGNGSITRRETIAERIKGNAMNCPRAISSSFLLTPATPLFSPICF